MSDNTVRFKIKIDGNLKEVEANADELKEALGQVKEEAEKMSASLINSNQIAQAFEQVSSVVQGLQSVMHGLTEAYSVQAEAETRLETVMRNTMDASNEEIQAIKDLTSAQQELGIVGDEVQLSGAQELATYLGQKESLEKLIPVMNDMIAQQYGYNATTESAVNIATMMGKVMEGQTGALSRYGYSFTEAQEAILKFGTEEEKAATLAEVITESVGGVNQALAQTPYGKIVQANNAFGDMKERIGALLAPAMKTVDSISRITIAAAGIGKGVASVKALAASIKSMTGGIRSATVAQHGLNAAMKANVFIAVASAVAGLVAIVVKLAKANSDAAESSESLMEANQSMANAVGDVRAEIDSEINKLKVLIEKNEDTTEAIAHLNEKYGEIFGNHATAAEWYDTLTSKSMAYCRQLGYEAKAKSLSASIGAKIVERDEKVKERESTPQYKKGERSRIDLNGNVTYYKVETKAYKDLTKDINELNAEIKAMGSELDAAWNEAAKSAEEIKATAGGSPVEVSVDWKTASLADLGKLISDQEGKLKGLIGIDDEAAKAEQKTLVAMKKRYEELAKAYNLASSGAAISGGETVSRTPSVNMEDVKELTPKGAVPVTIDVNLSFYDKWLDSLQKMRMEASKMELPGIDAEIERVKALRDEFEGVKTVTESISQEVSNIQMPSFGEGWGGIKGVGDSIRDINRALTESDDLWSALTGTVDGFISLMQGITQVVQLVTALTAAQKANATANAEAAATGAAASVASMPWVGPALAVAAVASVVAALASLPKFANGGLVYGPTLGLMGEYGGASSNPEVIAPLSKLKGMLAGGNGSTEVKFRIEGRELVGIMNKQNNIYSRTK